MGWQSELFWVRLPYILTGAGAINELGRIVKNIGAKKPVIITDSGIVKAGLLNKAKEPLEKEGLHFAVFDRCEPNAPVKIIQDCAEFVRKGRFDLLIGLGGGSVLDTTKLAAIAATGENENIAGYATTGPPRHGLPRILIPTTAGTGSEASTAAVLTDREGIVRSVRSEHCLADFVICDPELTLKLPLKLTAESGIDAFCHALEAYVTPRANALTEALDEMALKLISESLRPAYRSGDKSIEARYNMMVAATYAMATVSMTGAGLAHALSHAIQSVVNVSHAATLSVILPHVIEFNASVVPQKYARVAQMMGENIEGMPLAEAGLKAIEAVRRLLTDLNMPQRLGDLGVSEKQFPRIVQILFEVNLRNTRNNPRFVTEEDALTILKKAL